MMIHMNKTYCLQTQTTDHSEYNIQREVFIAAENIIQFFTKYLHSKLIIKKNQ